MTEKEKQAIEEIKKALRLAKNIDDITTSIRNEYVEIIVDLIDKQQKEIEELKKYKQYYETEKVIWKGGSNSISKDKIREIIEKHYPDVAITKLNELLEE